MAPKALGKKKAPASKAARGVAKTKGRPKTTRPGTVDAADAADAVKKEEPVDLDEFDPTSTIQRVVGLFSTHEEFFQKETPKMVATTALESYKIAGVTFDGRQERLRKLEGKSTTVVLTRDPDNVYDKHAVEIKTIHGGKSLGFIGREFNRSKERWGLPGLLGKAEIHVWEYAYGNVTCRPKTGSLSVGSCQALPFEMPKSLISRCKTLSDRLDASENKDWLKLKTTLLEKSRQLAVQQLGVDDEDPRCCISGLPTSNVEPIWRFEKKRRKVVLESFCVIHEALRSVLYPNLNEREVDAVKGLVILNRDYLSKEQAMSLYRSTVATCRSRGQEWTLDADPPFASFATEFL